MRSGALPSRLLVQLIFVLLVNTIHAGNLDYYQDVEPELPKVLPYKQMPRYLEPQDPEPRPMKISRTAGYLPWTYPEYLDYVRQKELLERRIENSAILDMLQNEKMKSREEVVHRPRAYEISEDYTRNNEDIPRPYISSNPSSSRFEDYGNVKIPFAENFFKNENPYYIHSDTQRSSLPESEIYPSEDVDARRILKLQGKLLDLDANRQSAEETKSSEMSQKKPEFTFKFDEPKINEPEIFAIRPNDPRYYEEDPVAKSPSEETTSHRAKVSDPVEETLDDIATIDVEAKSDSEHETEDKIRDKFALMKFMMPDRKADEQDHVVMSSTRMTDNDIYIIAIVAGCSAAAMFALVLIALTCCRLHRGAKAAADIEYPAYGVTGPNKDISPSGDQRLAHSAQMYHFQHQKQQIIAMENRTAASRDPGSVSEAESDEENEEGDYTVYECPGLASTGEMEVKNPMFHDDPTPATPPLIHKEEDHM